MIVQLKSNEISIVRKKILSQEEVNDFNLDSIAENSRVRYILEVDLEYCKELHDSHNDYPLCPEKLK